ncbi:MAG: hypothetical protein MJE66_15040 [Proteobacteria bacterium]|nr:hypothetical protein [Pseudomonadota bacterium]
MTDVEPSGSGQDALAVVTVSVPPVCVGLQNRKDQQGETHALRLQILMQLRQVALDLDSDLFASQLRTERQPDQPAVQMQVLEQAPVDLLQRCVWAVDDQSTVLVEEGDRGGLEVVEVEGQDDVVGPDPDVILLVELRLLHGVEGLHAGVPVLVAFVSVHVTKGINDPPARGD